MPLSGADKVSRWESRKDPTREKTWGLGLEVGSSKLVNLHSFIESVRHASPDARARAHFFLLGEAAQRTKHGTEAFFFL